jgi:hypothetical protein
MDAVAAREIVEPENFRNGVSNNRRNCGMPECFHVGQREQAGPFCDSPIALILDDR